MLVASAGAYATPAISARAGGAAYIVDRTFSCSVRSERYVDVNASVALPAAVTGHPTPAQMWLDTVHKTKPVGGLMAVVPQVEFESAKSNLQVDTSLCHRSPRGRQAAVARVHQVGSAQDHRLRRQELYRDGVT